MENRAINRKPDEKLGMNVKKSKNLHIRLMGHCIICLRKVNTSRKETSEYPDGSSTQPEVASKSPGFLTTFNQVWAVLQTKWKEKINVNKDGISEETGISLKSVLQTGCVSTNVSFSTVPTICEVCCEKIVAVENLMKAVRQQVREICMLSEQGRRTQDGGLGEFEKSLREKGLEDSVIKATLQFVGIFGDSRSRKDLPGVDDNISSGVTKRPVLMKAESDGQNKLGSRQDDSDNDTEDQTMSGGDDDHEDPNYMKEEPEDDNRESTNDEDGSEEEMEVDEEDPKSQDVEKDPLALFPEKYTRKPVQESKSKNQFGTEGQGGDGEGGAKFVCSCGKSFATFKRRRDHMSRNKELHPEYKPFTNTQPDTRQICDLCGEWVMHMDILQHYTDHLNGQAELVIKCPNEKCPYMFVNQRELDLHINRTKQCKIIGKEKCGPVCKTCGFTGKNILVIKTHLRDKHENGKEKKWRCPISECGKMFCEKQSFHLHMSQHRYIRVKITKQNCDKCGEDLKIEELEEHLKDKHEIEEVIGCNKCTMKFSGRDEMVEHLYEHRRTGKITCDICGEHKFDKYTHFREHYFAVHKLCPKRYKCGEEDCDLWFWRKGNKEDHERNMHKNVKQVSEDAVGGEVSKVLRKMCDLCDYEYTKEESLIKHNIRVHGADPLKCDICGEAFDDRKVLNKHKKEHAGIVFQKEWKCEVEGCGKSFKCKKSWKRHNEVGHSGVKPHVCDICGKGYFDPNSLKDHRNSVHLGIRSWVVCDECGERFTSGTTLKRHKLIHTGERPFGCEICGQRFRHKEVLKTHVKGHEEKGAGFKPNGPMKQLRKRKGQT